MKCVYSGRIPWYISICQCGLWSHVVHVASRRLIIYSAENHTLQLNI